MGNVLYDFFDWIAQRRMRRILFLIIGYPLLIPIFTVILWGMLIYDVLTGN